MFFISRHGHYLPPLLQSTFIQQNTKPPRKQTLDLNFSKTYGDNLHGSSNCNYKIPILKPTKRDESHEVKIIIAIISGIYNRIIIRFIHQKLFLLSPCLLFTSSSFFFCFQLFICNGSYRRSNFFCIRSF